MQYFFVSINLKMLPSIIKYDGILQKKPLDQLFRVEGGMRKLDERSGEIL